MSADHFAGGVEAAERGGIGILGRGVHCQGHRTRHQGGVTIWVADKGPSAEITTKQPPPLPSPLPQPRRGLFLTS